MATKLLNSGNLKDYHERDLKLEELVNDWLYGIDGGYEISGELSPIISNEPRSLTHWRVLTLECGNKRLSIYPDGGFANGWSILRDWSVNTKRYSENFQNNVLLSYHVMYLIAVATFAAAFMTFAAVFIPA